jgi:hypothetical protein
MFVKLGLFLKHEAYFGLTFWRSLSLSSSGGRSLTYMPAEELGGEKGD